MAGRDKGERDYYKILGVNPEGGEEEIKRAYRKLALNYHPDRNPGDKKAEERFKEINEAYGVLIDREKRKIYDRIRESEFERERFTYTQEDIFRDLFRNPKAREIFQKLNREFRTWGLRFDEDFFKGIFFSGKGFLFFGGGIFFWPGRMIKLTRPQFHIREKVGGILENCLRIFSQELWRERAEKITNFLLNTVSQSIKRYLPSSSENSGVRKPRLSIGGAFLSRIFMREDAPQGHKVYSGLKGKGPDLNYSLTISPQETSQGTEKLICFPRGEKTERLMVKIPAGIKEGTKLRLKGKGLEGKNGQTPGDLYLNIRIK